MRLPVGWVARSDVALAAVLVAAGLVEAYVSETTRTPLVHAVGASLALGALAWRRRFPLAVLTVALTTMLALDPAGQSVLFVGVLIAAYTTGSSLDGTRALAGLALAVGPVWLALSFDGAEPVDIVAVAVLYGGAWAVGGLVGERGRRAEALEAHAGRLEEEQALRERAALAEERARIARELHDIVSHSISVVAVQTQAVRRRLRPDQRREEADLAAVELTARQAMVEMRRLFGVLRSGSERPPLAPQPGLDQLPRLLQRMDAAGLETELSVDGVAVPLPPGVDVAAYRVLQEALTNALKHAPGCRVSVGLTYAAGEVRLAVRSDGPAAAPNGRGHGLIGMRERVALYGGTFRAGPDAGGGFRIEALLPVGERLPR